MPTLEYSRWTRYNKLTIFTRWAQRLIGFIVAVIFVGNALGLLLSSDVSAAEFRYIYQMSPSDQLRGSSGALFRHEDGSIYGTNEIGYTFGRGTVFRLNPPTKKDQDTGYIDIFSFPYGSSPYPNGLHPKSGVVVDAENYVYGTTYFGGGYSNGGVVYRLSPPTVSRSPWIEHVLHTFNSGKGSSPAEELTLGKNGELFGTAQNDSKYCGVVFKLAPKKDGKLPWKYELISRFDRTSEGCTPSTSLVVDAFGNIYGGLASGGPYGGGGFFVLLPQPDGKYKKKIITQFFGDSGPRFPSGKMVVDKSGAILSAAAYGGCGGVYKLSPDGSSDPKVQVRLIKTFSGGKKDGCGPVGLAINSAGEIAATTASGGAKNAGALVLLNTTNGQKYDSQLLYSFDKSYGEPAGAPIFSNNKTIFGTTSIDGSVWMYKR